MTSSEISITRLFNQKIEATKFSSAKELVASMGAMQAQDYAMSKWAIGSRLVHSTDEMVETALNNGDIIRSHLMRPTWHFVSTDDIYWMNELSAANIKMKFKSRHRELELSEELILKGEKVFENAISEAGNLTREELDTELQKANIKTVKNQLYHLLFCAELDGILCSGKVKDGKQTYDLLSKRVPNRKMFYRDESLAELAKRYFQSHGPATIDDFIWWSGLSVTDARKGLESIKSLFISEIINSKTYWFSDILPGLQPDKTSVHLLPAFDEYLIGYCDRSASLLLTDNPKAVSSNGIFYPVIVLNGQVIGTWKRTSKIEKVIVKTNFFQSPNLHLKSLIEEEANRFGQFLNKKAEINFKVE
jgi:hypothetical protein